MTPLLMSIPKAAKYMNVDESTMRELVRTGQIKSVTIGTGSRRPHKRVVTEDLHRFIDERSKLDTPTAARA